MWTDGTKTDVQIKGSRSGERAPASFREALFYSRIIDTLPSQVSVPSHYLGVADNDGKGMFIREFLNDAQSLDTIYTGLFLGKTPMDFGLHNFTYKKSHAVILDRLARFSASHWMDKTLYSELYLKQADLANDSGRFSYWN